MTLAAVHRGQGQEFYDRHTQVLALAYAANPARFLRNTTARPDLSTAI